METVNFWTYEIMFILPLDPILGQSIKSFYSNKVRKVSSLEYTQIRKVLFALPSMHTPFNVI